jgi:DNA-binding MarR family transcriptional regulator
MTKLEDVKLCVCYNLRKTSRAVTQFYDKMLEPSGLAITQFSLPVAISISKSPTITKLATEMIIDRTTLTRNPSILQQKGLVRMTELGNDKRRKNIVLTSKGEELLSKTLPFWEKVQRNVTERFGKENSTGILSELSKIIKILGNN